ncbi:MAG: nicotinate (nicotinamide) nucleotide adenylyltransferase [Oscillospiraceae bacterium]|nr:nicotinate (nicotinamide) nucleotide adenylyltransferase [Oscillospiraceae bacterium]MBQ2795807.1 nicotinate (nicotinamide) nucleotide adenylyltransferase [Oscillospiraceae bacterium]MBQ2862410.1 nicotinate (nicotinamide) nucleotide adenylyltransferase [Oscillospiraceae bacterium]MBQ3236179.1 nicotinate (nicotinamide) nucleotide adenylyltransferase [Oscillospiraceae bacterium]MBQ3561263.1 nicotinate (nicotinamide) nucleotide adenylyltransferase [Oscillospiraceae bacterium]
MKIGIYGGSFDPVHKGHVNAALTFKEELSLDKIIVIPAYQPPHKKGLALTPSEHRMNMCRLAFEGLEGFEVSDIEIKREDEGYMADTVEQLREIYPDDELFLLIGGDMLLSFQRWYAWHKITDEAVLAVAARNWEDDAALEAEAAVLRSYGAEVRIVPIDVKEISSTEVREAVRRADDISSMVPDGVDEYIWNHYLYYN